MPPPLTEKSRRQIEELANALAQVHRSAIVVTAQPTAAGGYDVEFARKLEDGSEKPVCTVREWPAEGGKLEDMGRLADTVMRKSGWRRSGPRMEKISH